MNCIEIGKRRRRCYPIVRRKSATIRNDDIVVAFIVAASRFFQSLGAISMIVMLGVG